MIRRVASVLGLLLLAACIDPKTSPIWELAGEPGLLYEVKRHYERNAVEENGQCPWPLLDGVTRSRVLEETEDRLVVEVGYYYRDRVRDDEDCDELRPNRCFIMRPCRGFAERTFTVDKTAHGAEVVAMSGPKRQRRNWAQP